MSITIAALCLLLYGCIVSRHGTDMERRFTCIGECKGECEIICEGVFDGTTDNRDVGLTK